MVNDLLIINRCSCVPDIGPEGAVILVDKEPGWTSFDVVARLRNVLKIKKIGHAGTLDPFATGLLLILTGKATKIQDEFMGSDKIYEADLKLGERTDSFDKTGNIIASSDKKANEKEIIETVSNFTGEQLQMPPMFSALKVGGKKLYNLARKGIEIEREPRKITINSIDVLDVNSGSVRLRISCSKGTYIRSLADDIGTKLGTYAYLTELRRISSGGFNVSDAFKINEFIDFISG
ncbi:MAG TPA: tRNA pseudouridine(55) synthase TruB [Clostridiales bacterium]|nr:tRNA pseudouridine(55) synthase TruB [Clostridiales bacterium]HQP69666.1 tRNA pseudouridine(55) synthase TruB [Clostridiales bacterium]